jgi:hypothetical protein
MELEERRELDAGLLVFPLRARTAFGLREQIMTRVMVLYDNRIGRRQFVILNKRLEEEIYGKISVWLDTNMCFQDILHRIGPEGVDLDQWRSEPRQ